ncbi:MAG: cation:dicarboxylase symporter family transporter [Lachnospiraceae bacterium]|nr:cation:dicarboxylase symporter family transporter [Lachnospiraceae bacterium]
MLANLISNATGDGKIRVDVGGHFGNVKITFRGKGTAFSASDIEKELLFDQEDDEANAVVSRLLNKLLDDRLHIENSNGHNTAVIRVVKSHYAGLIYTLLALVLGIATGLIMQTALPSDVSKAISSNLFAPVYTVFMNALKMIVAPLVFFSIASSIADFGDIKALGLIALKVAAMYLVTSAIAICVGFLTYQIFPIGHT